MALAAEGPATNARLLDVGATGCGTPQPVPCATASASRRGARITGAFRLWNSLFPDGRKTFNKYDRLNRLTRRFDDDGADGYADIGRYLYLGKWRVAALTYQNETRLTHLNVGLSTVDSGFDGLRRIVNHRWESFTTETPGAGTLLAGFEHQDGAGSPAPLYDRANNKRIEYKTHDATNSFHEQYKYDSVYRLTSVGSGSQTQNNRGFERGSFASSARTSIGTTSYYQDWDLDGVGNWGRLDDNANVETRTHTDFNEIGQRTVSGQNAGLTHDDNGNTTDTGNTTVSGSSFPGGGLRLAFDAFNRVKEAYDNNNTPGSTGDDSQVAAYVYDCHNRRMQKVVTNSGGLNGTTRFYYEGWRVVEERDGSDDIQRQFTYGNYLDEVWTLDDRDGVSVASLNDGTGGQRKFYHQNTLYHVYANTDEGGAIVEAVQSYDAYGKATIITGAGTDTTWFTSDDVTGSATAIGNPFFYTGQRLDPETGLMYYKNRYYSVDLGRFVGRDPIGSALRSVRLYEYVRSRPIFWGDMHGFDPPEDPRLKADWEALPTEVKAKRYREYKKRMVAYYMEQTGTKRETAAERQEREASEEEAAYEEMQRVEEEKEAAVREQIKKQDEELEEVAVAGLIMTLPWTRAGRIVLAGGALIASTGCGGGSTTPPPPPRVAGTTPECEATVMQMDIRCSDAIKIGMKVCLGCPGSGNCATWNETQDHWFDITGDNKNCQVKVQVGDGPCKGCNHSIVPEARR
ncbi:MAG: RHS repeat-associated core domain-containing protein [Planctomycetota bacterium]|nr:RHS repeat-associated core domain-containing protein [Planctomycetota bacterium]